MIYWRRYGADYIVKTIGFTMEMDGAYGRLLDHYYNREEPLPLDFEDIVNIARATKPSEREAVKRVIEAKFSREADGYHNDRADAEIALAQQARENGGKHVGKSGKKSQSTTGQATEKPTKKKPEKRTDETTQDGTERVSQTGHPSTVNRTTIQPTNPQPENPPLKQRHDVGDIPDGVGSLAAAALQSLQPDPGTPADRLPTSESSAAGRLAKVCHDNGVRPATPFYPLIVEWSMLGVTADSMRAAIAKARIQKPAPQPIHPNYLDPIIREILSGRKPANAGWKADDVKATALCQELGIPGPKRGEETPQFHARIEQALADRARSQVA